MSQLGQKLIELLLTICKFSTTTVVHTETVHNAVDDEETILITCKRLGKCIKQLQLMLWDVSCYLDEDHIIGNKPRYSVHERT